jgi:hypothetical protein
MGIPVEVTYWEGREAGVRNRVKAGRERESLLSKGLCGTLVSAWVRKTLQCINCTTLRPGVVALYSGASQSVLCATPYQTGDTILCSLEGGNSLEKREAGSCSQQLEEEGIGQGRDSGPLECHQRKGPVCRKSTVWGRPSF